LGGGGRSLQHPLRQTGNVSLVRVANLVISLAPTHMLDRLERCMRTEGSGRANDHGRRDKDAQDSFKTRLRPATHKTIEGGKMYCFQPSKLILAERGSARRGMQKEKKLDELKEYSREEESQDEPRAIKETTQTQR